MNEDVEVFYRNIYDSNGDTFALDTYTTCYLKEYGFLGSKIFYEATKRLDLESQVDIIVLKTIIKQILLWEREGKFVRVLVDLSDKTIIKEGFISWILDMAQKLDNSVVIIKLDGEVIERYIEDIALYQDEKIEFMMKNFGSQITNIVEAKDFPIDIVCVDNDYILNLSESRIYEEMLNNLLALGKSLGKKIVISDIVTENQYNIVTKTRADYISGQYLSRYEKREDVTFENFNCRRQ